MLLRRYVYIQCVSACVLRGFLQEIYLSYRTSYNLVAKTVDLLCQHAAFIQDQAAMATSNTFEASAGAGVGASGSGVDAAFGTSTTSSSVTPAVAIELCKILDFLVESCQGPNEQNQLLQASKQHHKGASAVHILSMTAVDPRLLLPHATTICHYLSTTISNCHVPSHVNITSPLGMVMATVTIAVCMYAYVYVYAACVGQFPPCRVMQDYHSSKLHSSRLHATCRRHHGTHPVRC